MDWLPAALVIGLALTFAFTNGFHDAANSVATAISTRALSPRIAIAMAAGLNLVGAFLGEGIARTIGEDIIVPPSGAEGLVLIASALLGAIAWNVLTWWWGMPSSSTHALIGGLAGASLAAGSTVLWDGIWSDVVLPMLVSPLAGLVVAYLAMRVLIRVIGRTRRQHVGRDVRRAQVASAGAMALGHGLQDAAKTMGVVILVLAVSGHGGEDSLPWQAMAASALALAAGTYAGGWRIVRTLGRRIITPAPEPAQGMVAEASAAGILYLAAVLHAPVSTTHTITASILGTGLTGRRSALRWDVVGRIVTTWVLTFPAAAGLSALLCVVLGAL
ncbi:inorganic phosphate transporter [Ornithinimicrobium cavernae]|uniref:inorganic phosphate transporter n=1 Tax=Ornithinimicrobium cavernae TaxID=2666047 RepID=UPI000D69BA70|nr:inorganic phosphate transporter [Ornithinimicrobium cavernae]